MNYARLQVRPCDGPFLLGAVSAASNVVSARGLMAAGVFASSHEESQVQVLSWLVAHGTAYAASWQAVRLVRVVLHYRIRCKEIDLLREQANPVPDRQPEKAVRARRARHRRTCR